MSLLQLPQPLRLISCTASHIRTDVHTHAHAIHLKHVPAITQSLTHTELFALGARVLRQSVGELSEQPPQRFPPLRL